MSKYPDIIHGRTAAAEIVCGATIKRDQAQTTKKVPWTFTPRTTTLEDLKAAYCPELPPLPPKKVTTCHKTENIFDSKQSRVSKGKQILPPIEDLAQNARGARKSRKDEQKRSIRQRTKTSTSRGKDQSASKQTRTRKNVVDSQIGPKQTANTRKADDKYTAHVPDAKPKSYTPKPPDMPRDPAQKGRAVKHRMSGGQSTGSSLKAMEGKKQTKERNRVDVEERVPRNRRIAHERADATKKDSKDMNKKSASKDMKKLDKASQPEGSAFAPRPPSKDRERGQVKRSVKQHLAKDPKVGAKNETGVHEDNARNVCGRLTISELRSLPLKVLGQGAPSRCFYEDASPQQIVRYKQCRKFEMDILDAAIILKADGMQY